MDAKLDVRKRRRGEDGAAMDKDYLLLKRAALSRPSGEWSDDDFDVLAGVVVSRIFKVNAAPVGQPWMWTLIELLRDCGPCNGQLLQVREELQSRIDQYHRERSGDH